MDHSELKKLTREYIVAMKLHKLKDFIKDRPESVVVIRSSLGLSQRKFIELLRNKISQVTLVKYETGKSIRMRDSMAQTISDIAPNKLNISQVLGNYKKFSSMKSGHLTSSMAKKLQKISLKRTTYKQRSMWGQLGAIKANSKQKLTLQEKQIKRILDKVDINYDVHSNIDVSGLKFNIDFVIRKNKIPIGFIEASKRKHDLTILAQAYAYRARLLRAAYPKAKLVAFFDKLPYMASEVLNMEFDIVLYSKNLNSLEKFLHSV